MIIPNYILPAIAGYMVDNSSTNYFTDSDTNHLLMRDYEAYCIRHFETIEPWFPQEMETVVDIGAGTGGIDIFICQERHVENLHIIEGDGTKEQRSGYRFDTEAWADRGLALSFIRENVMCNVYGHDPDPAATIESDLIVSLKSWGHHYPVSVYLGFAQRSLRSNGRVIMDLRAGRNGLEDMERGGFRCIGKADYDTPKCQRLIFEKT